MKKKNILLSLGVGMLAISTAFTFASINRNNQVNEIKEVSADTVEDYYAECEGLEGNALKSKLKTIISKNISVSYDWSRYEAADEDPDNNSNIVTIYARTSLPKNAHVSDNQGWNREHTFPQSKMGVEGSKNDNHIIFASDCVINGKRGNHRLGELTTGDYLKDSYGNTTICRLQGDTFDPGDTVARGLVARSTMYASVLYGYDIDDNITSYAKCLEWHFKYFPSETWDMRRNNTVYSRQKNRNPFVDHPEYAAYIWGHHDADCEAICEQYMSKLTDLSYTGTPTKTTYYEGDTFNPAGLTITASFDNGSSTNVTSSVKWSPKPLTAGTTSVTGTYTYNGVSKTVTINGLTVKTIQLNDLTLSGTLAKTTYVEGETFDPTGLVVTAVYNSGKQENVTSSVVWPSEKLAAGTTEVVGTYQGKTVKVTGITVNKKEEPVPPKSSGGGCSASITSNSSIVFIGGIALLAIAIRMAVKARKDN